MKFVYIDNCIFVFKLLQLTARLYRIFFVLIFPFHELSDLGGSLPWAEGGADRLIESGKVPARKPDDQSEESHTAFNAGGLENISLS